VTSSNATEPTTSMLMRFASARPVQEICNGQDARWKHLSF